MHIEALEVGKVQVITCAHVTLWIRIKVVYLQRHIQGLGLVGGSQMLNKDGG